MRVAGQRIDVVANNRRKMRPRNNREVSMLLAQRRQVADRRIQQTERFLQALKICSACKLRIDARSVQRTSIGMFVRGPVKALQRLSLFGNLFRTDIDSSSNLHTYTVRRHNSSLLYPVKQNV